MLYPIELLRHTGRHAEGAGEDGVHVNGTAWVCHVVRGLFSRSPLPCRAISCFNASARRAICTTPKRHHCKVQDRCSSIHA
ncbi:MAG: hypothetical protein JWQ69_5766 [Pseudomonas sp.]|nr:hypothetical protein [Pseudomonas sp.]